LFISCAIEYAYSIGSFGFFSSTSSFFSSALFRLSTNGKNIGANLL